MIASLNLVVSMKVPSTRTNKSLLKKILSTILQQGIKVVYKTPTMEIDSLLTALESKDSDEEVQEKLAEIKRHLIQFAEGSKSVLNSKEFFNYANS
jgi:hypothetical protein